MLIALIGFLSGILSGGGIGGGIILIPSLILLCSVSVHGAQTVNLIYFVFAAVFSLIIHIKNGLIDKKITLQTTLCALPFAILGAYIAVRTNVQMLRKLFAIFTVIFGIYETATAKNEKN